MSPDTMLQTSHSLRERLETARRRAARLGTPVVVSLTQPLSEAPVMTAVFAAGTATSRRVCWSQPSRGLWVVGAGEAATLQGSGIERFESVKASHRQLMSSAIIDAPEEFGTGPVFFGGFSFDTEAQKSAEWDGLGEGRFVLPRLVFAQTPAGGWLTTNAVVDGNADVASLEREAMEELAQCQETRGTQPLGGERAHIWTDPDLKPKWGNAVRQVLQMIDERRLEKVVLARRLRLRADAPFFPPDILGRLNASNPECLVFAFGVRQLCFLGATPEILVRLKQGQVSSTCLAGSSPRGKNAAEDGRLGEQLLGSGKEQQEHALVVKAVREGLEGLCSGLQWNQTPTLAKLRNVQHMSTSFSGRADRDRHVLDFVERLHPTPAVGGAPRETAMKAIREVEGMDRGWYAAPVGWIDRHGDGEFGVAIRSALVKGDRATLYAGAGIVAGSDTEQEFEETELKFGALRSALVGNS